MSSLTRRYGVSGIYTIVPAPGTNLFNAYTPGSGTVGSNGGGGNNGNRRALARRSQVNKGTMEKPQTGTCNTCNMPTLSASINIFPPTYLNFLNYLNFLSSNNNLSPNSGK